MPIPGLILIAWMMLLCLVQIGMLWKYVRTLRRAFTPLPQDGHYPPMLAVLCLRGADPFLRECLMRLLASDYPSLRIRIVVDSETDPALPQVKQILSELQSSSVELMILKERLPHCSGKVSGLLMATENLPEDCEIVAWIDGDSMLHRTAFQELAQGLRDPSVGAVSGNRWYLPPDASLSGVTRMLWNGFAVPAMNLFGLLWGGCMAARASDFRDPGLRHLLAHSFIEDSTISTWVRSSGRSTQFVASAMLLNRESISLRDYYRFATRQLFTVRIDNSRWRWLALHMLTLNMTILFTLLPMAMPSLYWWRYFTVMYFVLMGTSLLAIPIGHQHVKKVLAARGEHVPRISLGQWVLFPMATLLPNQLNLLSTLNTYFIRKLTWRGITYRFGSNPKCTIVDVQPVAIKHSTATHSVV